MLSEIRKGPRADAGALGWWNAAARADTATSVVVLAEIRRGIHLLDRRDPTQAAALAAFYDRVRAGFETRVLGIDEETMMIWARITVPDPLPRLDSLIAATALRHDLTVVTRNVADFAGLGLPVLYPFTGTGP